MRNKKCIYMLALLLTTGTALALALSTSFGWFSSRLVTQEFPFTTARLASIVTLEKGVDFDHDGYLNVDATTKNELFENEVKIQDPNNQQKLLPAMQLENLLPSEVHTYRLTVINNGTVNSRVVIQFTSTTPDDLKLLNLLVARPIYIDENHQVQHGTTTYLGTMVQDAEISGVYAAVFLNEDKYGDISLPVSDDNSDYTMVKIDGVPREYFFQIEMLTFDQAKDYIPNLTYDQYMNYANAAIDYTNGSIYLSVLLVADDLGVTEPTDTPATPPADTPADTPEA